MRTNIENNSDKPPLFKTWNRLYAFIISQWALLVLLFYLITKYFQ